MTRPFSPSIRLLSASILVSCVASARAQVWDKYIGPGLTYRMELDPDLPRTIHALRFDMHSTSVRAASELGQLKMYNDDKTKGRATVSDMVKKAGAIAGVNASFFPYTGHPIGLMVRNKELVSPPMAGRPEFAWGPFCSTGFPFSGFFANYRVQGAEPIQIDAINDEAKPDWICLDTDTGALALTKGGTGVCALFHVVSGSVKPNGSFTGEVDQVLNDANKVPIPQGSAALMGTGIKAAIVGELKQGDRIKVSTKTIGFDGAKFDQCVCGGPVLLKNGRPVLDWSEEGFNKEFSLKRHPRTAVGRDSHGDIWLVEVDGRQSESVGATLEEMADIMLKFGCVDAINLDGGGSTTMNILGVTVNRPSDNVEREVANGILFYGPEPPKEDTRLSLRLPATLSKGDKVLLRVAKPDGETVPDSEILWAATGAGWIDQGGLLRADKAGTVTISAYVHGQVLTAILASN